MRERTEGHLPTGTVAFFVFGRLQQGSRSLVVRRAPQRRGRAGGPASQVGWRPQVRSFEDMTVNRRHERSTTKRPTSNPPVMWAMRTCCTYRLD